MNAVGSAQFPFIRSSTLRCLHQTDLCDTLTPRPVHSAPRVPISVLGNSLSSFHQESELFRWPTRLDSHPEPWNEHQSQEHVWSGFEYFIYIYITHPVVVAIDNGRFSLNFAQILFSTTTRVNPLTKMIHQHLPLSFEKDCPLKFGFWGPRWVILEKIPPVLPPLR